MTQPPMTPNYQSQSFPPQGSSGLATAAMVVGIIAVCLALVLGCIPFFGPGLGSLLGIVAILLGVVAMSQGGPASAGRARVGLILGIVAIVIAIAWFMAVKAGLNLAGKKIKEGIDNAKLKADEQRQQFERDHPTTNTTTEPSTSGVQPLHWRLAPLPGLNETSLSSQHAYRDVVLEMT